MLWITLVQQQFISIKLNVNIDNYDDCWASQ